MSLLGTLAKVAIGIAIAKGVSTIARQARTRAAGTGGAAGGTGAAQTTGGGLKEMLGSILSGDLRRPGGGGLGGFLERLVGGTQGAGASQSGRSTGGLADLIGGLTGGRWGDFLGGLTGKGAAPSNDRSFGEMLDSSLANKGEPDVAPTAEQNAIAGLMVKAMIQAAKADGTVDENERKRLMSNLGEISAEEMAFVQAELAAPVDIGALVQQVPDGLQAQVYTMSVMAIDLDNENETKYLQELAAALGLDQTSVNQIHTQLGVSPLVA